MIPKTEIKALDGCSFEKTVVWAEDSLLHKGRVYIEFRGQPYGSTAALSKPQARKLATALLQFADGAK